MNRDAITDLPPDLLEPEFLTWLAKQAADEERARLGPGIRELLAARGAGPLEESYDLWPPTMFPAYVTDELAEFCQRILKIDPREFSES